MKNKIRFAGLTAILVLLSVIMTFFTRCKVDNSENNPLPQPVHIPGKPGALKINVSSLILHPGDNPQLIATLYNADGTLSSSTQSLIWQSSNNTIASVSNGIVTANTLGFCEINVTDGVHGILRTNVSVVASGIPISTKPTTISWPLNADMLILKQNTMETVSSYTIYNASGQVVQSPALTFIPDSKSNLSFTGNNINSGDITGSFEVMVKSGNDTLLNTLKVLVLNTVDTLTTISAIPNCPYFFPYYNVSAEPLIIQVTKAWIGSSGFQMNLFTTSPTAIIIDQPSVAIVNSAGLITSVGPGNSKVKVEYNTASVEGYIFVDYDFTGSWGGTAANGDNYNFCFDRENPDVFYRYNIARYEYGFWEGGYIGGLYENGNAKIVKNGIKDPLNKVVIYSFPGIGKANEPLEDTEDLWFCQFYTNGLTGGTFLWQNDLDKMKFVDGNNTVVLTRGEGDCKGGGILISKMTDKLLDNPTFVTTFQYDDNGRVTAYKDSVINEPGSDVTTFEYPNSTTVIEKGGSDVNTYTLNEKGQAIQVVMTGSVTDIYYYTYDINGFNEDGDILVVENGNVVKSGNTSYEFDLTKINTIGSKNMGFGFFGNDNKNLITTKNFDTSIFVITYEFDSKGRVSKETYSEQIDGEANEVEVFTYSYTD